MMSIRALPSNTVRALGAGQVISDPVAVIKELLDNAFDAKASKIDIEVSSNVLDVLQICDNGHGVPPHDRNLLCHRHCTSKISTEDDLKNVGGTTLGFRGEALASIAESSGGLSIATRTEDEQVATVMTFDRTGKICGSGRASLPIGTVVKVTEFLRHNPVRRRLAVKSCLANLLAITRTMQAYAFARPHVRLALRVSKQEGKGDFLYVPAESATIADVALKLFGVRCSSQCMPAESEHAGTKMTALLPKPNAEAGLVSGFGCFISCDGRPMSSSKGVFKTICRSFRETYQQLSTDLAVAKDVICVLNITCTPATYDINVEPRKDDVILEDADAVLLSAQELFSSTYRQLHTIVTEGTNNVGSSSTHQLPTPLPSSDPFPVSPYQPVEPRTTHISIQPPLLTNGNILADVRSLRSTDRGMSIQEQCSKDIACPDMYTTLTPCVQRSRRSSRTRTHTGGRVNRPFVPPSSREVARPRIRFDHLEQLERRRPNRRPPIQTPIFSQVSQHHVLGALSHEHRPLSPPHRNTDIRSFCQPQAPDAQMSSLATCSFDKNPTRAALEAPQRDGIADLGMRPSTCTLERELSTAVPEQDAGPLAQQSHSIRMVPAHSMQTVAPTQPHRDTSMQLLASGTLSPATRVNVCLSVCILDMCELARLSISDRKMASHEEALTWMQDCAVIDVEAVVHYLQQKLAPIENRCPLTTAQLHEAIVNAISAHVHDDSSSELLT